MEPDAFVGKPVDLVMTGERLARLRRQIRWCILCGRSKVVFVGVLVPGNAEMAEAVALVRTNPVPAKGKAACLAYGLCAGCFRDDDGPRAMADKVEERVLAAARAIKSRAS